MQTMTGQEYSGLDRIHGEAKRVIPTSGSDGRPRPTDTAATSTVLFVDDEPAILEGVKLALRKEPYEIVTASSPASGLDILAKQRVDVVVSDERMPGMSGSEFVARVRKEYPGTIRIMLTGQASLEAAIRAINEGEIYRFLTKPCSPLDLGRTIHQALLLRDLSRHSERLVAAARDQRALFDDLERRHPGITKVDRNPDGRIVIDEAAENVEALLEAVRREMGGD